MCLLFRRFFYNNTPGEKRQRRLFISGRMWYDTMQKRTKKGDGGMLTILMGRAKTGKSAEILRQIAARGDASAQILLVPEHASHQAEMDLCRACGPTASRHAEVLSFRRLGERVLSITGGIAQVTLDAGGKLMTMQKALLEVAPSPAGLPAPLPEGGIFAAAAGFDR